MIRIAATLLTSSLYTQLIFSQLIVVEIKKTRTYTALTSSTVAGTWPQVLPYRAAKIRSIFVATLPVKEERDTLPLGLDATWLDHLPTTGRTGMKYLHGRTSIRVSVRSSTRYARC
jgi:hypothetical protein